MTQEYRDDVSVDELLEEGKLLVSYDWKDPHGALEAFGNALEDIGFKLIEVKTGDDSFAFYIEPEEGTPCT